MDKFASIELKLKKSVKKGEKGTLLTLFSANERFKHLEVLLDAEEGTNLKVVLEGLGGSRVFSLVMTWTKGRKKQL